MKSKLFASAVLAGLTVLGCTSPTEPGTMRAAASAVEPLDRDGMAMAQYAEVQAAFAAGRTAGIQLAAYELQPVGDVAARAQARASALGMKGGAMQRATGAVSVIDGDKELSIDPVSGTERWVDHARFHAGPGVPQLPLTEADYVRAAREHVLRALPELASRDLRAYKLRRYMNDSSGPDGKNEGPTVYQVAVAFNEVIDGVPVIGSGGKVAVHLTPEGDVISHESTVRAVAQRFATLSGGELLEPEVARKQVEERLARRGVKLDDYSLTRSELGYLRLGRHGAQSVLVPHYAFVYEPVSREVLGKKLIETLPAVTSASVLERLRQDQEVEAARLAARHALASAPDEK